MTIETDGIYPFRTLDQWALSGRGGFTEVADGVLESYGGPGLFWYRGQTFADFDLLIEWRLSALEDNSGVFLRFPALGTEHPDDWQRAVTEGFEVQIDDRGYDPRHDRLNSPLHLTGAVYELAPATRFASRPVGAWNAFRIAVRGPFVSVDLNEVRVAELDCETGRPRRGHIGLQAHHDGSRVQFRNLCIQPVLPV